ncbi:MAG: DUF3667 domain-containing protein [Prevotella sp.]|nr:DUF3667 domain-containing protein [Prevotella sp.]
MKRELIAYYHRFCQWQQAEPHFVNRHEGEVQHCHNCGTEFTDNFCPRCSQRAGVGRVGWNSIKDNIAVLWGMDSRSLVYTLFQLLARPGYLVRDYISGHRQVSFPPVKMLVIVSLFVVIVESVFHLKNDVVPIEINIPEIDNVIKWFNDNKNWGMLLINSLLILPTWMVFRFAPRYRRHTLPEGFFLQVFLSVLGLLLGLLGYLVGDIENVIVPIYMIITYRQLFGYGWWGTLWRCIVTYLSVLVMLLPLVTIVFLVGYSEGGVNVTIGFGDSEFSLSEAGPILLSILILLIAVMLYITHRINKRTYHSRE